MDPLGRFLRVLNVLPKEKIDGPPRDFLKANLRPPPREYIKYSRELPRAPHPWH